MSIPKRTAAKKKPDDLIETALRYHAAGDFAKAEAAYRKILARTPDWPEVQSNLGAALEAQGKFREARACYACALALKPHAADIHYNLGNALKMLGELAEAQAHYKEALRLKPDYAQAHNNLGVAFKDQGRLGDAAAEYGKALALAPDYADAHNNLGNVLKEQGEFGKARMHYDRALALDPGSSKAHYNRAELTTFHAGDAGLFALEALAAEMDRLPAGEQVNILFALAKALDDTGDYARAFGHALKGNALKRRTIAYGEPQVLKTFKQVADVFDVRLFERFKGAGYPSVAPIFIIGMPRCGSTLVEQILASHAEVHGAGELDNLHRIIHAQAAPYPDSIRGIDPASLRGLGEAYIASLPSLPPGKTRITDKRLFNFLHVGLIRLILPDARIVHVKRDPVDNCISCFFKLFTANVEFSYDLGELGRYFRHYSALMAHWRAVLPEGAMLEVSYEALVGDLEGQTRRLLDYCGLSWDDRCLRFYETDRPVITASAVQVRQPLFASSLNRRKHYEKHLAPLLAELAVKVTL